MSDRILDISRARNELGYTPRTTLPEAIHRTALSLPVDISMPEDDLRRVVDACNEFPK